MNKKIFVGTFLALILVAGLFFWRTYLSKKEFARDNVVIGNTEKLSVGENTSTAALVAENEKVTKIVVTEKADQAKVVEAEKIKVPFTSQAPFGNWSYEKNQNGCEEASIAMAMRWIKDEKFFSPSDAQQEIINISNFEEKNFGNFIDASAEEVGKIFSQYYDFENFSIVKNPSLANLKSELAKGKIILVPAFGRALKNPNYTKPGPITHMLVIVGYDAKNKEFITNDPGTKRGENYHYNENVLFNAIWAYPAGKVHPEPPKSTNEKTVLIISRN